MRQRHAQGFGDWIIDRTNRVRKASVAIPKEVREALNLVPGERLRVLRLRDRVELISIRKINGLRGRLRGMDTTVAREDDRV